MDCPDAAIAGGEQQPAEERRADAAQPMRGLDAERRLALAAVGRREPMQFGDAAQLRAGEPADQDPVLREGALRIARKEAVGDGAREAVVPGLRIEAEEMGAIVLEIGAPEPANDAAAQAPVGEEIVSHLVSRWIVGQPSRRTSPTRRCIVRCSIQPDKSCAAPLFGKRPHVRHAPWVWPAGIAPAPGGG